MYKHNQLIGSLLRVATGVTFKQAKGDLSKRGWNPSTDWEGDTLYWLNPRGKRRGPGYEKLEAESWAAIETGSAKL
jgi:hypothetical protein